jgi:hypothetical protein
MTGALLTSPGLLSPFRNYSERVRCDEPPGAAATVTAEELLGLQERRLGVYAPR